MRPFKTLKISLLVVSIGNSETLKMPSFMSLSSWSIYHTYISKSFILVAADWPNTLLQAAIKEGLMSSSPMEYSFLHLSLSYLP